MDVHLPLKSDPFECIQYPYLANGPRLSREAFIVHDKTFNLEVMTSSYQKLRALCVTHFIGCFSFTFALRFFYA